MASCLYSRHHAREPFRASARVPGILGTFRMTTSCCLHLERRDHVLNCGCCIFR